MMHEREHLLAPSRHASAPAGRNDRLMSGEIGNTLRIAWRNLRTPHGKLQCLRHVRVLHEAEIDLHSGNLVGEPRDNGPVFRRNARRFRHGHGNKQQLFVQDVVVPQVLGKRQRDARGHAAQHDGGAGNAKRRIGLDPLNQLL